MSTLTTSNLLYKSHAMSILPETVTDFPSPGDANGPDAGKVLQSFLHHRSRRIVRHVISDVAV